MMGLKVCFLHAYPQKCLFFQKNLTVSLFLSALRLDFESLYTLVVFKKLIVVPGWLVPPDLQDPKTLEMGRKPTTKNTHFMLFEKAGKDFKIIT